MLASFSGYMTPLLSDLTTLTSFIPVENSSYHQSMGAPEHIDGNTTNAVRRPPVVVRASSGKMFIYFYGDAASEASGFRLKYSLLSCPGGSTCSGNGQCNAATLECQCGIGWTGLDCSVPSCQEAPCTENGGVCSSSTGRCVCPASRDGVNCERFKFDAQWHQVDAVPASSSSLNWQYQGRASHTMVAHGDLFYVFGGFAANAPLYRSFESLLVFNTTSSEWSVPLLHPTSPVPSNRYEHTAIVWSGIMYVYGGRISGSDKPCSELWSLNLQAKPIVWTQLAPVGDMAVAVAMHTATLVEGKMLVIWGRGEDDSNQVAVQEYVIGTNVWRLVIAASSTAIYPKPVSGHSAVYSTKSHLVMVYGGFLLTARLRRLYTFDPFHYEWKTYEADNWPHSALHSAVLGPSSTGGDLMLLMGGCQYLDDGRVRGSLCHSNSLWIVDLTCMVWIPTVAPDMGAVSLARFGHTAVSANGAMWIFGGYDGTYRNDLVRYVFARCDQITNKTLCLNYTSLGCMWLVDSGTCVPAALQHTSPVVDLAVCKDTCPRLSTCANCKKFSGCSFWNGVCLPTNLTDGGEGTKCPLPAEDPLKSTFCTVCQQLSRTFTKKNACGGVSQNLTHLLCKSQACHNYSSCDKCVENRKNGCVWCPSLRSCISTTEYEGRYPYSQCLRWLTESSAPGGVCAMDRCSSYHNCSLCLEAPGCGWCEDGSGTGSGRCSAGGALGPVLVNSTSWLSPANTSLAQPQCAAGNWSYTQCPLCQCNGRSTCNMSDTCTNCSEMTTGKHCERCRSGMFGRPDRADGACRPCVCNGHGATCHDVKGTCTCEDFGSYGPNCGMCDQLFYGNGTNGGLCFRHVFTTTTAVNSLKMNVGPFPNRRAQFICSPGVDRRVVFTIKLNVSVNYNLTIEYSNPELVGIQYALADSDRISSARYVFKETHFNFDGIDKIRVYLTDLPENQSVSVEVLFLFEDAIDLLIVFATFFGCFLTLLLIAMLIWYTRQYISMWRAQRHRQQELISMAQRPFATIRLASTQSTSAREISPLTVQPLAHGDKIALCSFAVRLPGSVAECGNQSRLAVGSVLLSVKKQRLYHRKPRQRGIGRGVHAVTTSRQHLIEEV
eukprot:scpid14649/ scgid4713/ Putative protein tag-53